MYKQKHRHTHVIHVCARVTIIVVDHLLKSAGKVQPSSQYLSRQFASQNSSVLTLKRQGLGVKKSSNSSCFSESLILLAKPTRSFAKTFPQSPGKTTTLWTRTVYCTKILIAYILKLRRGRNCAQYFQVFAQWKCIFVINFPASKMRDFAYIFYKILCEGRFFHHDILLL